ncbi:hypothetical protein QCA50_009534 [Cerrena zonata]|uniref:Uncharacterized protein n=1 Tax=Cerrena zonata TaxID=2478898 RepID=A0AAW0G6H2_9APHY
MTSPNTHQSSESIWQWVPVTPVAPPGLLSMYLSSDGTTAKRRLSHEQSSPALEIVTPEDNESPTKKRRPRLSNREKFALAFDYITHDVGLPISHFLWELFLYDDGDQMVKRTPSHDVAISILISGSAKYTIPQILEQILKFPSSTPSRGSSELQEDMFSTTKPWSSVKRIKPALTTLAVSLVTEHLVAEVKGAVKGSSGLYGSVPPLQAGQRKSIGWMDISKNTPSVVQNILQAHCPVALYVISNLVSPEDSVKVGGVVARKMRKPELTSAEILSTIAFCRTPFARLLPTARAILYFACGAQQTIFQYHSRIGFTPSWNTTVSTLKRMAAINAEQIRALGRDPGRAAMCRTDNIQQWLKRRESRIGRASKMKIGMSAIVTEIADFDAYAFDVDDKLYRIR